ncbi:MAG: hypothetical protein WKG06_32615 [Segetibacter sp.]
MFKTFMFLMVFSASIFQVNAQETHYYNLAQLLKENKLVTNSNQQTQILKDEVQKEAISTKGIVWLKDVSFAKGTIEVDLRGKNVFLQSFLGIAFHAVDSITYDAVYFRPFNFKHQDTLRRKWSAQYFSMPDYDYDRLRKESPLVYENAVTPVPNPDDWFHATIVIENDYVIVYVNHSGTASLKVKLLNHRSAGKIGLWTSGLSGDFANLTFSQSRVKK